MLYFGLHWSEQLRVAPVVELNEEQEAELTKLARSKRTSVRLSQRARIVLLAAQGLQNKDIAEQLGVGRVQVSRWRERYVQFGLEGIERDLPRGAPPVKVDVQKLVELTTHSMPVAATRWSTRWSTRKMGAVLRVSASTVMRHWQANGLKLHVGRGFKVSRDRGVLLGAKLCLLANRILDELCQRFAFAQYRLEAGLRLWRDADGGQRSGAAHGCSG